MKGITKLFILLLVGMAIIHSCVDPFNPPRDNYESLLVVEAFISDDDTAQLVRLSNSSPIDLSLFTPETGASVVLEEVDGRTHEFVENGTGDYWSNVTEFKPIVGNDYILHITLGNGNRYVSKPVVMKKTAPIKDLYFRQTSFISQLKDSREDGFEILLDTEGPEDEPAYFRYEWDETFRLNAPYTSSLDYDFDNQQIIPRTDNITICWRNRNSTAINVKTTESLTTNEIKEHPILFVPFSDPAFRERYSIEVRQYAIDRAGYQFWTELKESNELTGSLFDTQPYPLIGNMMNETNPMEPALGYFDVASVESARIYINNNDVPREFSVPSLFSRCLFDAGDTAVAAFQVEEFVRNGFIIVRFELGQGYIMVKRPCADCTLRGSNVRPNFWVD